MTKVKGIYCLKKNEIIRGFNSFKNILIDSKVIINGFLKLNIQVKKEISDNIDNIYKDPLENVKVGFVVSKRIVKNAALRNRLKRISREAYRTNKYLLIVIKNCKVNLIFSYNQEYKNIFNVLKFDDVSKNMRALLMKTTDFINKQK